MPMALGKGSVRTPFTLGAFVSPALLAAAGFKQGQAVRIMRAADGEHSPSPVVCVYSHGDATEGHLCLCSAAMQHAGLTCNSQVSCLCLHCSAVVAPLKCIVACPCT